MVGAAAPADHPQVQHRRQLRVVIGEEADVAAVEAGQGRLARMVAPWRPGPVSWVNSIVASTRPADVIIASELVVL